MKILAVFIDMLSSDFVNISNSFDSSKKLDRYFESLGGTVYSNMFSTTPDTPRSMSGFWSGFFSPASGSRTRMDYPRDSLNQKSLIKYLSDAGFIINCYGNKISFKQGLVPDDELAVITYTEDKLLSDYIEEIIALDDSCSTFNFIILNDYHDAINFLGANIYAVNNGLERIYNKINYINTSVADSFDMFICFSDHGHLMVEDYWSSLFDLRPNTIKLSKNLLNYRRTKIFAFVRTKSDSAINYDNSLRSIVDFFPTVLDYSKVSHQGNIDGVSLFSEKFHNYLIFEDFLELRANLQSHPQIWGYLDDSKSFMITVYDDLSELDDSYILLLSSLSESFNIYLKRYESSKIYKKYVDEFDSFTIHNLKSSYTNLKNLVKRFVLNKIYYITVIISKKRDKLR